MRAASHAAFIISDKPLTRELLGELLRTRFGMRIIGSAASLATMPAGTGALLLVWDASGESAREVPAAPSTQMVRIDSASSLEDIVAAVRKILTTVPTKFAELTPHEVEVLLAVASGQRNAEIARRQRRSTKTVEKHRANLQRKLGMRTVAQLTAFAIRAGLLDLDTILAPRRSP